MPQGAATNLLQMMQQPQVPTAAQESLQEPAVDPISLFASMITGGAFGLGQAKWAYPGVPRGLRWALKEGFLPGTPGLQQYLMEGLHGAGNAGRQFLQSNLLGSLVIPQQPKVVNLGSVSPGIGASVGNFASSVLGHPSTGVASLPLPQVSPLLALLAYKLLSSRQASSPKPSEPQP